MRFFDRLERGFIAAQAGQDRSFVVPGLREFWLVAQGGIVGGQCLFITSKPGQGRALVAPGLRVVGAVTLCDT